MEEPTVKLVWSSPAIHLSSPVCKPCSGVDRVTLVPGVQKSLGRHISCRLSSQPQAPCCSGTVVTLTRFSTSARSAFVMTPDTNWTMTGIPTPTVPPLGMRPYVAVTLGLRVVNVDFVDVAVPSGPVAAMVNVYAVDGRSRSVAVQSPSGPACPGTVTPLASTSVTEPKVPDDALTVIGALGRTPVLRSAGDTSSTAGVVSGVGVVVGEACFEPDPAPAV